MTLGAGALEGGVEVSSQVGRDIGDPKVQINALAPAVASAGELG